MELYCPICKTNHVEEELDFVVIEDEWGDGTMTEKAVCIDTGVILGYRRLDTV